ncbi:acyltransferase [Ectopseudomonas mendocina]|uniref:Acyltransferase n=1 Tax=Ectopseudomonas mendocina TaxID=300 RepID=A0ABD7RXI6_ECTME|nr:acyltransferase family protein [Pseudomonas mendocina]TRO14222.1 acyltransferase [Pseudomonas mendocina]TRO19273.1 acyltransferase [Pseudomonas mendocina]
MNSYIGLPPQKAHSLSPHTAFRQDIQGLRAIAVLAVILFHVNNTWLPGGFIGVDVFFVISGYLITSIITRQRRTGNFHFLSFYKSRIKRIVPAYLFLLALVASAMVILLTPTDFAFFWKSLRSALYFSSNYYFADFGDYFAPSSHELPLLHTWSLAVEMQFYLILPVLLVIVPIRHLRLTLPALTILLTGYAAYRLSQPNNKQEMYFSLLARTPEFLVGACLAVLKIGENWSKLRANLLSGIGLAMLAGSFIWISESTLFPGMLALLPCLGTGLMIAARQGVVASLLSTRSMAWIGTLSYSLYLWHWPILAAIRYYLGTYEIPAPYLLTFTISTLALAYLSYRFIELPFRTRHGHRQVGKWLGLYVLALAPLAYGKTANHSVVPPLPLEQTRYAVKEQVCQGQIVGDCIRGDREAKDTLLVLGDSHAAQLNLFFEVVGKANRQAARIITASSCVNIPGSNAGKRPKKIQEQCKAQIIEMEHHLAQASRIVVAGKWVDRIQSKEFMAAFDRFLALADQNDQQVLVMAQLPMLRSNVQRIRRFSALGLPTQQKLTNKWQKANARVEAVVAKYPSARFLDLSGAKLFTDAPFDQGTLIYYDEHHLNEIGSRRYGNLAIPYFKNF